MISNCMTLLFVFFLIVFAIAVPLVLVFLTAIMWVMLI
jgi:hypothetical protein